MTTEPVRTWDSTEAAEVWKQGAARRAQTLAVATEQLFDAVGLRSGMHVLDVAAGTGDQSVLAAQRVGPSGSLLATDISQSMLDVAAQAAIDAGLYNVTTLAADATSLAVADETFDAAICRFGLMFMPDLNQVLVRIRRSLRPEARFAALVWSSEEKNPYNGLQLELLREMGRMPSPPPSLERALSLGNPEKLERAFDAAGFKDVRVRAVATPRVFESVEDAFGAMRATSPAASELTLAMSDAEQQHFAAELKQRLAAFVGSDGQLVLPGEALLIVGTK